MPHVRIFVLSVKKCVILFGVMNIQMSANTDVNVMIMRKKTNVKNQQMDVN